jgi:hypothetical protein
MASVGFEVLTAVSTKTAIIIRPPFGGQDVIHIGLLGNREV